MNTTHRRLSAPRPSPFVPRRYGFTLIELMVVIGIISLLIAIALPAFSAARNAAKRAATETTLRVLDTVAEQFHADTALGGFYPPSVMTPIGPNNPHSNGGIAVGGANLLVWGLAGADLLGTAGFRNANGAPPLADDYVGGWVDDMHRNAGGLYGISAATNKPVYPRSGPYVDMSKVKLTQQVAPGVAEFKVPASASAVLQSHAFLDSWDQPILYYRANPNATFMTDEGSTLGNNKDPEMYDVTNNRYIPTGIYNLFDNAPITGGSKTAGMDFGAGTAHFGRGRNPNMLGDPRLAPGAANFAASNPQGCFTYQIRNESVTAKAMPQRPDSFILISAGADGLYGTADDIGNFPINK